ncbi:MAG: penicillin-binding transpeptidase domain-containing protein [Eubacteriales bacterium]|nr:penicillin-binding transpeptidase domain-containing protein [Eubacteriales bacterium]
MKMITKRGLFLLILVLAFCGGLVFLTVSLVNDGSQWVMQPYNSSVYHNGELIGAGKITDCNGRSLAETNNGKREYNDSLTTRKATLHTVGDTKGFISTGVQTVYKAKLTGYSVLTGIYSVTKNGSGNDMQLTINADVCDVAYEALSDYKAGCVGVINYKTGDIVCMVSTPSYDPQDEPYDLDTNEKYEGAYINRLLSGLYTPGSTFKIVTAICALENIPDIKSREFKCTGEYDPGSGTPIECNARHGTITFEEALAKSCNSAFAEIAIELGPEKLADTAKELGLTSAVSVSGDIVSSTGRFFLEKGDADDYVGWTGIGQGDTLVSPAAMLRLVGAIANDGKAVSFNLVESFATKAGKALDLDFTTKETPLLSSETASEMKSLLRNNVKEQYGDYNYEGLHLCAKSGTAQIDEVDAHNTAWFTGFMDDEENPYAFVVLVEYGNSGSQTAGRIANKVLQALVKD